jgi:hypothetical protein
MTTELKNMENLELLAEVVNDLKKHHLVGNALFDWIPKFFRGTDNKNWSTIQVGR